MTDRYAVIGNPVAHSKSPQIHAAFAAQTDRTITYERVLAPVDGFAQTVRELIAKQFAGANVTVPFKQEAFALATRASARARAAGAANTLTFTADGIEADNTDGAGLVNDLRGNYGIALAGARVLLLGAGGAARGVLQPLLEAGVASLTIANRTWHRAAALASACAQPQVQAFRMSELAGGDDVVINATSASLAHERLAIPGAVFDGAKLVYDMMYAAQPTLFLRVAMEHGAPCTDGLGMLVEQAAEAFYVWHGVRPNTAPVLAMLRAQMAELT
jgi:shikimate dehydrogenase